MSSLVVLSSYWPTVANPVSGIFVVQQVAAMARLGFKVTVVVDRPFGRRSASPIPPVRLGLSATHVQLCALQVPRMPERFVAAPGALTFNVHMAGAAAERTLSQLVAHGSRFSGCIVHGARYFGWTLPRWRRLVSGRTCVVLHGVDPGLTKPPVQPRISEHFARHRGGFDAVIAVGKPLVSHAMTLGFGTDDVTVIPNGTDLPPLDQVKQFQRPASATRRILSVSNLVELKGIELNLRALAAIRNDAPQLSWEYTVVGDGPERARLEGLAVALRISDRVHFLGRIGYAETMACMQEADIFSLPSWGEAFGIVYLEAMARMRAAIGCRGNGAADIITDGHDGLLVEPLDVSSLQAALTSLLRNPQLCSEIGLRGRATAERFTWDENARRMAAVLALDQGVQPCV